MTDSSSALELSVSARDEIGLGKSQRAAIVLVSRRRLANASQWASEKQSHGTLTIRYLHTHVLGNSTFRL
ncbi:unnamed protein product [Ranitomeya imitator]|uniref:Uncharacterized protein n=1 Tax=Ranitomeya imitator TaxID=111125 RepID=A0ABN9LF89_9NEOB|nr:unnamed protein product [Ranitomeya imitator]